MFMSSTLSSRVCSLVALVAFFLFAPPCSPKGGGVGFFLEGTVTNVGRSNSFVQVIIKGRLRLVQYPDGQPPAQIIEYICPDGLVATFNDMKEFFAMSADWRGGALRQPGTLSKILEAAEKRGNVVKFELLSPRIDFAGENCPAVASDVIRVTDVDLR
jgi:hypothetical protein